MRPALAPTSAAVLAAVFAGLCAAPANAQKTAAGGVHVDLTVTPSPEAVYETMPACRAFDTRTADPLLAPRAFVISGPANLKAQGGPKAGCGVPASATAVTISVGMYDATDPGLLAGYPRGGTAVPIGGYGPAGPTAANATIALNNRQLSLAPSVGSVQVTGDVTGYFAPQMEAYVSASGAFFSATPRVVSVSRTGAGAYTVVVDRDVYYCAAQVTPASASFIAGATTLQNNQIIVQTYTSGSDPIAADAGFNISVHC